MRHFPKHISLRVFLLALFLSHMAGISFFTHTHVIRGITIVHSHYSFKNNTSNSKENKAQHTHTDQSLILISQTTHWSATFPDLPKLSENLFIQNAYYFIKDFRSAEQNIPSYFHLRSPPFQG